MKLIVTNEIVDYLQDDWRDLEEILEESGEKIEESLKKEGITLSPEDYLKLFKVEDKKLNRYDLEKSIEYLFLYFSFEGEYYGVYYSSSPYIGIRVERKPRRVERKEKITYEWVEI